MSNFDLWDVASFMLSRASTISRFHGEPSESISAVLQEQLGLRLEPQKVPVEFYVIDSAEQPSAN